MPETFLPAYIQDIVKPLTGAFSHISQVPVKYGEARFCIMSAALNDISQAFDTIESTQKTSFKATLDGAGSGLDPALVKIKAIAEGLERYSCCAYDEKLFLRATAEELGTLALDLDTIPRCSEQELAHPSCPLVAPDKKAILRWVKGISLFDGQLVWLPAVMVYMHILPFSSAERFWFPISTGCAAHESYEQALLGAICEIIERDAISTLWLQKMQLPRLELDTIHSHLQATLTCSQDTFSEIEHFFFDATTEIGIPTVYGLQIARQNDSVRTLVMCSTSLNPTQCVARVIEESSASRVVLQELTNTDKQPDEFIEVVDGAHYMALPEHQPAFDFLIQSPHRRHLSEMPVLTTGDAAQDLAQVINRLSAYGMHIFAVDLTTDEALRAGMRVVRAIIPELQPLSFSYRARFLGHPRLYEAPKRMGHRVFSEADLNSWPQPFA